MSAHTPDRRRSRAPFDSGIGIADGAALFFGLICVVAGVLAIGTGFHGLVQAVLR